VTQKGFIHQLMRYLLLEGKLVLLQSKVIAVIQYMQVPDSNLLTNSDQRLCFLTPPMHLGQQIHRSLVQEISSRGQLGDDSKHPLLVCLISRISSVTYLDFILVNRLLENAEQNLIWQNILISDVAW
jgi:hypothetical protein